MDNVTHALAGALLAVATTELVERRHPSSVKGLRTTAFVVGILTAELPDADLLYAGPVMGMGNLGYLLHHRGHTHTLLFALLGALLVWAATLAFRRTARTPAFRTPLLILALAGTFSHILLDYSNNYGVHPFWPLKNKWYYGDSIFIIEPWFWIIALPALFFAAKTKGARVLYGVLLFVILSAAWLVTSVGRPVAVSFLVGAVVWSAAMRYARPQRRMTFAIGAWCLVEALFFTASSVALHEVRKAVGPQTFKAAALTPSIGNPLCFSAQIVQLDRATYGVSRAVVAPFPLVHDVAHCRGEDGSRNATQSMYAGGSSRTVAFQGEWNAPRAELVQTVAANCEVAAAMRFIRVPQWEFGDSGSVRVSDVRFGRAGGGFAAVSSRTPPATCPKHVPGWVPPRADIIGFLR